MPSWNDCVYYHYEFADGRWQHYCDNHHQQSDHCRFVDICRHCFYYRSGQITIEEVIDNADIT